MEHYTVKISDKNSVTNLLTHTHNSIYLQTYRWPCVPTYAYTHTQTYTHVALEIRLECVYLPLSNIIVLVIPLEPWPGETGN